MNGMNEQQQMQMQNEMMRDFLKSYNKTTKICFDDCVRNFTSGELSADEKSCGQRYASLSRFIFSLTPLFRCVTKYLEYSARVAKEFMKRNNPGAWIWLYTREHLPVLFLFMNSNWNIG